MEQAIFHFLREKGSLFQFPYKVGPDKERYWTRSGTGYWLGMKKEIELWYIKWESIEQGERPHTALAALEFPWTTRTITTN